MGWSDTSANAGNVDRYVGLSLGGGKSDRTSIAVIDYYKKQGKAFVVDVYDSIGAHDEFSADEVLLEILGELSGETKVIAVDAPLTLPPCLNGCKVTCTGVSKCKDPAVRWMQKSYSKIKGSHPKAKPITPYSQRPVDLYFRYKYYNREPFQDETMGANQAPRAARMQYLKGKIQNSGKNVSLIEVWPKLTLFHSQKLLKLGRENVTAYRNIEDGVHTREKILQALFDHSSLFVYDRDSKKMITNISAFDALICAWVAMLEGLGQCEVLQRDLPLKTGWVHLPEL